MNLGPDDSIYSDFIKKLTVKAIQQEVLPEIPGYSVEIPNIYKQEEYNPLYLDSTEFNNKYDSFINQINALIEQDLQGKKKLNSTKFVSKYNELVDYIKNTLKYDSMPAYKKTIIDDKMTLLIPELKVLLDYTEDNRKGGTFTQFVGYIQKMINDIGLKIYTKLSTKLSNLDFINKLELLKRNLVSNYSQLEDALNRDDRVYIKEYYTILKKQFKEYNNLIEKLDPLLSVEEKRVYIEDFIPDLEAIGNMLIVVEDREKPQIEREQAIRNYEQLARNIMMGLDPTTIFSTRQYLELADNEKVIYLNNLKNNLQRNGFFNEQELGLYARARGARQKQGVITTSFYRNVDQGRIAGQQLGPLQPQGAVIPVEAELPPVEAPVEEEEVVAEGRGMRQKYNPLSYQAKYNDALYRQANNVYHKDLQNSKNFFYGEPIAYEGAGIGEDVMKFISKNVVYPVAKNLYKFGEVAYNTLNKKKKSDSNKYDTIFIKGGRKLKKK